MATSLTINLALCNVESDCLEIKKEIADGSMLKGHHAKAEKDIDQEEVVRLVKKLKEDVDHLQTLVHNGFL